MKTAKLPPIHPGKIMRKESLELYHLSAQQLAQNLKINEQKAKELVEEKETIDADLFCRLGLCSGFRENYWLDLQKHYELEYWKEQLGERMKKGIQSHQPTSNVSY